jgi:hypothetical protein
MKNDFLEKRSEPRSIIQEYYSVNLSIDKKPSVFQFLIWDMSLKGMCLLVKEDSDALKHLQVGRVFNMKYYKRDTSKPAEYLKTEIRHISKDDEGRFKGHYLVGIAILENHNSNRQKANE